MSDYQGNIIIKNPATPAGPFENGAAPGVWKLSEVLPFVRQGIWPTQGVPAADTFFRNVSLLLSTTSLGNANNNLFVDSSGAFNPISRNGNTTQGSFTPYGASWSNYFDGSGDFLSAPSNAAFDLGSSSFTVECWFNANSFAAGFGLISRYNFTSVGLGWLITIQNSTTVRFVRGNDIILDCTVSAMSTGAWYHVAAVRNGSTLTVYLNGVQVGQATGISNFTDAATALQIGRTNTITNDINGYISNVRVVKGTALYTAAFTPPTTPLTAITNTSLLTCQSNRFRDASTNNFTITVNGNTSVTEFSPFAPAYPGISYNQSDITNWSGYFDGTGDYLTVPDNAAFSYGTGDFTLECFVYASGLGATRRLYYHITTSSTQVTIYQLNTNYVGFYASNGGTPIIDILSNTLLPANAWTHIAAVRSGSTFTLYQNGVSVATGTSASSMPDPTGVVNIGALDNGGEAWLGYISNFRVVKGTAVYTSAFTPPTTNLTAISGTSLLTMQNAAFTDNSTNNFVITTFGNTTVTGNSPFNTVGYWSNYFNGGTNYLTTSSTTWTQLGTGNFTVEGWGYINAYGAYFPLCDTRASPTFSPWILGVNSSGFADFYYGTTAGGRITDTVVTGLNTWVHLAAVRSGSTITLYVNGVARGTATYSSAMNGGAATIGRIVDGQYANGYISNFRVVVGTAVYTSNFTPPTTPLTAISGTQVLTCQNGRIIDNSTNNSTITVTGTVSAQSFDPFYTSTIASNGGSMYFDGTGDYLTTTNYNLSGDATVECWLYVNSLANPFQIFGTNNGVSDGRWIGALVATNGALAGGAAAGISSGYSSASGTIKVGQWTHIAWVKTSSGVFVYVNGTQVATCSLAQGYAYNATPLYIGRLDGNNAYCLNGYISNLRMVNGTAIYTSSFTPPTAPANPTPATVLMLNGMNAGAYDATAINNMETVGNAQVRFPTPFAPANYYAGAFDGTGDYLTVPSNAALNFGTGDFTWEGWIYANSLSNNPFIMHKSTGNGFGTGWFIEIGSGAVYVGPGTTGGSFATFSASSVTTNAWFHLAITRVGTTLNCFINGTSVGTATAAGYGSSYDNSAVFGIGGWNPVVSGYDLNGLISNVRVVKGTAVYTANFTPSTTPLTAISGTSLLTCQNKTFIDNSANAFTITAFGNATAGAIGPFTATGGTSMYFDGSGDGLKFPSNTPMSMGTGNFTWELWVSSTAASGYQSLIDTRTAALTDGFFFGIDTGTLRPAVFTNATVLVSSTSLTANTWQHLALVRSSGTLTIYLNGTSIGSVANSTNLTSGAGVIGASDSIANPNYFNGYIDDMRITRGIARYTTTFTPPTQAFPPY